MLCVVRASHVSTPDTAAAHHLSLSLLMNNTVDVVVVGAGMAGLSAALQLSNAGVRSGQILKGVFTSVISPGPSLFWSATGQTHPERFR